MGKSNKKRDGEEKRKGTVVFATAPVRRIVMKDLFYSQRAGRAERPSFPSR